MALNLWPLPAEVAPLVLLRHNIIATSVPYTPNGVSLAQNGMAIPTKRRRPGYGQSLHAAIASTASG
jgi:hypothetical protein